LLTFSNITALNKYSNKMKDRNQFSSIHSSTEGSQRLIQMHTNVFKFLIMVMTEHK